MNLYSIGLFVHIGATIVLIAGSILATLLIRAGVLWATTLPELRAWLAVGRPLPGSIRWPRSPCSARGCT